MAGPAGLDPISWGTLPDWVAAIGTVGALFFALATLRTELREQRVAKVARRVEVERSRKAQARRVVLQVWSEWPGSPSEGRSTIATIWRRRSTSPVGPPWDERLRVRVTNYSDLPIYWVRAKVMFGNEEHLLNVSLMIPPGETRGASSSPRAVHVHRRIGPQDVSFLDADGAAWSKSAAASDVEEIDEVSTDGNWPGLDWPRDKDFERD